jgi:hypothetical protein
MSFIHEQIKRILIKNRTKRFLKIKMTIVHGVGEKRPSSRDI